MNALYPSRYKDKFPCGRPPKYDNVVDKTDFKIGQDSARNQRIGDSGGSLGDGLYDFVDGKVDMQKISQAEIALRSGALDKADVDTLAKAMEKAAQLELDQSAKEAAIKAKNDLDSARQSYIDKQTGFNQEVDN